MDNASKALLIAGATFIAILLISLTMWFLSALRDYNSSVNSNKDMTDSESFNRFFVFAKPADGIVYGYEVYNIVGKVVDYNSRIVGNEQITSFWIPGGALNQAGLLNGTEDLSNLLSDYCGGVHTFDRYRYSYTYGNDGRINFVTFERVY